MEVVKTTFFPDKFDTEHLIYRTDLNVLYRNVGSYDDPEYADIASDVATGTVLMFAGLDSKIPGGYLRCNGAEISRTDYADLFDVIGNKYGIGTATTFRLPDFETPNRFPRGVASDSELGVSGGEDSITLTTSEIPSHKHSILRKGIELFRRNTFGEREDKIDTQNSFRSDPHNGSYVNVNLTVPAHDTENTGGGDAHENRPAFLGVYFIIKT